MRPYYYRSNHLQGVAYSLTTRNVAELGNIDIVTDWGTSMNSREKIPSVLSYSDPPNGERQFGADISEEAVTMMNFKLELEIQDKRLDELELTLQVLEGTDNLAFKHIKKSGGYPEYSYKAPGDIVTDYLTKVCERAWEVIEPTYLYSTRRPPVDIVITVPVVCGSLHILGTLKTESWTEMVVPGHQRNISSGSGCWLQ